MVAIPITQRAPIGMLITNAPRTPGEEWMPRKTVPGVRYAKAEAKRLQKEAKEKFLRQGPSPTVCRVMAKFSDALGHPDDAEQWSKAAEMPPAKGNT